MKKKIAIIGSGYMAVVYSKKAREMGLITHSFSNNPDDKVKGHCDFHHNVDIFNVKKIVKICKNKRIQGVLPTTELTIKVASEVSNLLNLKGVDFEIAKNITNKDYVRDNTRDLIKIKHPRYIVYKQGDETPNIDFFPVIVKPTSLGGKRGISIAKDNLSLNEAIQYATKYNKDRENNIIIEEFISGGQEYSIESLSFDNKHTVIQITKKLTSKPPNIVELGHFQPAELSFEMKNKINLAITELLTKLGLDYSATHTEIKIVKNEIYLIELNSRLGGDHIAYPLTQLSTGYDYIRNIIEISLGEFKHPNPSDFKMKHAGVIFVTAQTKKFQDLFNKVEEYDWLYEKFEASKDLKVLINNQGYEVNYFIYKSNKDMPIEIKKILEN